MSWTRAASRISSTCEYSQAQTPRETLGERRHALRVAVRVRITQVDEVGELEDRALRLLAHARAVANREQHDRHGHAEEHERPRLRLRGDRSERAENEQSRLVRQQAAMQRPPASERVPAHLKGHDHVDERAVDEVLRDRGEPDGPWLADDLRAGTRHEQEYRRGRSGREHRRRRVEAAVVPALTNPRSEAR